MLATNISVRLVQVDRGDGLKLLKFGSKTAALLAPLQPFYHIPVVGRWYRYYKARAVLQHEPVHPAAVRDLTNVLCDVFAAGSDDSLAGLGPRVAYSDLMLGLTTVWKAYRPRHKIGQIGDPFRR